MSLQTFANEIFVSESDYTVKNWAKNSYRPLLVELARQSLIIELKERGLCVLDESMGFHQPDTNTPSIHVRSEYSHKPEKLSFSFYYKQSDKPFLQKEIHLTNNNTENIVLVAKLCSKEIKDEISTKLNGNVLFTQPVDFHNRPATPRLQDYQFNFRDPLAQAKRIDELLKTRNTYQKYGHLTVAYAIQGLSNYYLFSNLSKASFAKSILYALIVDPQDTQMKEFVYSGIVLSGLNPNLFGIDEPVDEKSSITKIAKLFFALDTDALFNFSNKEIEHFVLAQTLAILTNIAPNTVRMSKDNLKQLDSSFVSFYYKSLEIAVNPNYIQRYKNDKLNSFSHYFPLPSQDLDLPSNDNFYITLAEIILEKLTGIDLRDEPNSTPRELSWVKNVDFINQAIQASNYSKRDKWLLTEHLFLTTVERLFQLNRNQKKHDNELLVNSNS